MQRPAPAAPPQQSPRALSTLPAALSALPRFSPRFSPRTHWLPARHPLRLPTYLHAIPCAYLPTHLHASPAVHVQVARKGAAPSREGEEGQRHWDWHIDAHLLDQVTAPHTFVKAAQHSSCGLPHGAPGNGLCDQTHPSPPPIRSAGPHLSCLRPMPCNVDLSPTYHSHVHFILELACSSSTAQTAMATTGRGCSPSIVTKQAIAVASDLEPEHLMRALRTCDSICARYAMLGNDSSTQLMSEVQHGLCT
jgi:hypothetical protein